MKERLLKRRGSEKGVALLTVLIALMLVTILLFEFQFSAMVERKLAYNELNQIQAYYLAKSGARIGLLRVALYGRILRDPSVKSLAKGFDVKPYLEQIWRLPLPPIPPDASTLKELVKADRDAAEKFLKQSKVSTGKSSHVITPESSKINLNFLQVPKELQNERIDFRSEPNTLFEYVGRMLITLIENFLKESEDPFAEYGNLRPEDVVFDIMDWVNPGSNSYAGGAKDSFYEQQNPPYKAKRGRFYTVEELRMVKSITPRLFQKLRPHVTVYSYDGKININEANDEMLKALYPDFTEDDLKRMAEEKARRGGAWASEKDFVKYVTDTLGRSGFTNLYKDEKQYPFTVGTQSFIVEGVGTIQKSGSTITKTIRVAVALATGGKGGNTTQVLSNITDPNQCNATPGALWYRYTNECRSKPTNQAQCQSLGGSWTKINNQDCCQIPNLPPACLTSQDTAASKEANQLKVLYWSET